MTRLLAGVLLFSLILSATDLSGTWTGLIAARNGDLQDITFKFTHTGAALTGKMYRDTESVPISEGKISGEQVSFTVTVEEQVGNLFLPLTFTFTGKIKGAEIELTREREPNPAIGGNPANRGNQKQTFNLKRLF
jgi:hypothetical protein